MVVIYCWIDLSVLFSGRSYSTFEGFIMVHDSFDVDVC